MREPRFGGVFFRMTILHIDFETRSTVDLKKAGLDVYTRHPDTDVWCMAYAEGDGAISLWERGVSCHKNIAEFVTRGGTVVAHNAAFELAIWNHIMAPRYGWPRLDPAQVRCTMAMAYAMALPGSLENAAAAVGLDERKDQAGRRIMLQLSKPRMVTERWSSDELDPNNGVRIFWHDDLEKLAKLYAYCKQDVEVERKLHSRLLELSASEQRIWQLDYAINQRGVAIDIPAVQQAIKIVEAERTRLDNEMRRVTNNAVATCQAVSQLGDWIRWQGVQMDGVAKADVIDALNGNLPTQVRYALQLRQEAAKSSTAKLTAMLESVSADGRVRNTKQYHAAHTGRWGGRRMQPDNYPRPRPGIKPLDVERMFTLLENPAVLDFEYGPVLHAMSDMLRGFIIATPDDDIIASDFSNIEGRVLAWLAGEAWKLQAFRDQDAGTGPELYLVAAGKIYHRPASDFNKQSPERDVGKRCELAFGFGGALGAWRKFEEFTTKDYVPFSNEKVLEINRLWRDAHPMIVRYWYDLERAMMDAVLQPGSVQQVRGVRYKVKGSFLFCQLPSGRLLSYPYPRVEPVETPWGELKDGVTYMGENSLTKKWERLKSYGGKASENITQAVARDLLAEAMLRLSQRGYRITMHVHDEIVVEVPSSAPDTELKTVETLMAELPTWAAGLPVVADGWRGRRYRKA